MTAAAGIGLVLRTDVSAAAALGCLDLENFRSMKGSENVPGCPSSDEFPPGECVRSGQPLRPKRFDVRWAAINPVAIGAVAV